MSEMDKSDSELEEDDEMESSDDSHLSKVDIDKDLRKRRKLAFMKE
jgi:hypothetical protein